MSIGDVATKSVDALKSSPALLFLILLDLAVLVIGVWFLRELVSDVGQRNQLILERCLPGARP